MTPSQPPSPEVESLAAAGRKIEAIKLYREETGARLRDAKAVVDAIPRRRAVTYQHDPVGVAERVSRSAAAFLAATILGVAGATLTAVGLYRTEQASDWPVVPGEIVRAEAIRSGLGIIEGIDIEYTYVVGGRAYRGDRIRFAELSDGGLSGGVEARYAVRQPVMVHYDAAQPENAVLDTEIPLLYWLVFGGSLFAAAWGMREWGAAARREREGRDILR